MAWYNPFFFGYGYSPFGLYGSMMYNTAYFSQQLMMFPFQMMQMMIMLPFMVGMFRYMSSFFNVFKV